MGGLRVEITVLGCCVPVSYRPHQRRCCRCDRSQENSRWFGCVGLLCKGRQGNFQLPLSNLKQQFGWGIVYVNILSLCQYYSSPRFNLPIFCRHSASTEFTLPFSTSCLLLFLLVALFCFIHHWLKATTCREIHNVEWKYFPFRLAKKIKTMKLYWVN